MARESVAAQAAQTRERARQGAVPHPSGRRDQRSGLARPVLGGDSKMGTVRHLIIVAAIALSGSIGSPAHANQPSCGIRFSSKDPVMAVDCSLKEILQLYPVPPPTQVRFTLSLGECRLIAPVPKHWTAAQFTDWARQVFSKAFAAQVVVSNEGLPKSIWIASPPQVTDRDACRPLRVTDCEENARAD